MSVCSWRDCDRGRKHGERHSRRRAASFLVHARAKRVRQTPAECQRLIWTKKGIGYVSQICKPGHCARPACCLVRPLVLSPPLLVLLHTPPPSPAISELTDPRQRPRIPGFAFVQTLVSRLSSPGRLLCTTQCSRMSNVGDIISEDADTRTLAPEAVASQVLLMAVISVSLD